MIKSIIFAALFIVLAIVIAIGKGDMLIAGYNTASEKKRNQIDIHRLRKLMTVICLVTAGFCGLMYFIGEDTDKVLTATAVFVIVIIAFIVFGNSWTKKK